MVPKKNPKSDLESKRSLFLQIGFIIALSLTLIAFEWSNKEVSLSNVYHAIEIDVPEEMEPITLPSQPEPPKLPKPIDILVITEEIVDLNEDIEIPTTEDLGPIEIPINFPGTDEIRDDDIVYRSEVMPEYPGGEKALMRFLASNLKYPDEAIRSHLEGTVYVRFVINRYGKVTGVELQRGLHHSLDNEALRVVSLIPDWKPGEQNMRPVNVYYTVPIRFRLHN